MIRPCHRWYHIFMQKTTVYLPEDVDQRLETEAAATGLSKAELIRRGVTAFLDATEKPREIDPLPVFSSGRSRTAEEMRTDLVDEIAERAARR